MARVLIVGCGCRGRALAAGLADAGLAVRGTTRDAAGAAAIEAAGAEAVVADPNRLATLLPAIDSIAAICWLLGSAEGGRDAVEALHGARLRSLLERLVDTPVRGFVYEVAGTVDRDLLDRGAAIVREAGESFRLPVRFVDPHPDDHGRWLGEMIAATRGLLVA